MYLCHSLVVLLPSSIIHNSNSYKAAHPAAQANEEESSLSIPSRDALLPLPDTHMQAPSPVLVNPKYLEQLLSLPLILPPKPMPPIPARIHHRLLNNTLCQPPSPLPALLPKNHIPRSCTRLSMGLRFLGPATLLAAISRNVDTWQGTKGDSPPLLWSFL